ncbi:acyl-CoA dehydrogenase family protein [Marinivivus vitaminiproducens]|uniref:acyl-CoA dehydrogenase family protein n=1 Tax=Marinivivus vitaminiproducens TaxID=3035935 RepID=UPI00279CFF93|nr:acyl-CoA/acyl-ACP dehydrogenase [Geminicoccaceae bacterium SCSIO 64248]
MDALLATVPTCADPSAPDVAELLRSADRVTAAARARTDELDRSGAFPDREVALLHETGLLAAPLPEALGGLGLACGRPEGLAALLRRIGSGDLPLGRLYEGHVNAAALIARFGRPDQQERFARLVRQGFMSAVWNAEGQDGLRLLGEGGARRLAGSKILASGAGHLRLPLITPSLPDRRIAMLCPLLEPGAPGDLGGWRVQGMRASATGTVDFTGLDVTEDAIIGAPGDYLREPWFKGGAWRFAAVQLGAIEGLVDILRTHLTEAGRDGDPHQRMRFGEALIAIQGAGGMVRRAAALAETSDRPPEEIVAFVDLTRCAVERAGMEAIAIVQRSIGLSAMLERHPAERAMRDLATYLRQPGPDAALTSAAAFVLGARSRRLEELWCIP